MATVSLSCQAVLWISELPYNVHPTKHVGQCLHHMKSLEMIHKEVFIHQEEELLFLWLD